MGTILLVEDSNAFGVIIRQKIEEELSHQVVWKTSYAETKELLETSDTEFLVAVLDLHLPDAYDGEIVDLVLSKNIPVIIVTAELNEALREKFFTKRIVDYILKNNIQCFNIIVETIRRLAKNHTIKILVVDDSKVSQTAVTTLLKVHKYHIHVASDGEEALQYLEQNPDIKVVITDYSMPGMNGIDLTNEIRRKFNKEEIAVMGISAYGNTLLSARFIKNGANDFLTKPFSPEEFYWRLTHIIDTLEYITFIKEASVKDFMTGLYNRRYLFDKGQQLIAVLHKHRQDVAIVMLDIDYFKKINDTYGHAAGDKVICFFARQLQHYAGPNDIAVRLGGEEFCLLQTEKAPEAVFERIESLRKNIEQSVVSAENGQQIRFTVSAGICTTRGPNLDKMLSSADKQLYAAKTGGRNQVRMKHDPAPDASPDE